MTEIERHRQPRWMALSLLLCALFVASCDEALDTSGAEKHRATEENTLKVKTFERAPTNAKLLSSMRTGCDADDFEQCVALGRALQSVADDGTVWVGPRK